MYKRQGQSRLRTAADASADQSVHAVLHQEACQCAVTAAVGINNFRMDDFAVRCFIKLELFLSLLHISAEPNDPY